MCYSDDDDDHDDDDNDDDDNDDGDDDNEDDDGDGDDDDHDHHDDGDDDDDGDMLFADTVWLVKDVKRNSLDSWADSAVDSAIGCNYIQGTGRVNPIMGISFSFVFAWLIQPNRH